MEKTSVVRSEDIADKLWEKGTRILTCTLYFVSGFVLSGAGLFSMKTPLSVSLAAACTGYELFFAAAGGLLGGFLRLSDGDLINATVPLVGITAVIFAIEKMDIRKKKRTVLSVSVFALCAACGTAVMFSQSPSASDFILVLCSALICAGCVTF